MADAPDKTTASVVASLLAQGFDFSTGAWKSQELVKGVTWTTSLASLFMERGQAGWDFGTGWDVLEENMPGVPPFMRHRQPSETTPITNEQLKTNPFFAPFLESDLTNTNATIASEEAGEARVRYDLLARAIPAMSNAAAANNLPSLTDDRNFDMAIKGKATGNGPFPTGIGEPWRHSDFKVVALLYVYPMYQKMITVGGLK